MMDSNHTHRIQIRRRKFLVILFPCFFVWQNLFCQFVGIGTSAPAAKLHVVTGESNTEIGRFQSSGGIGMVLFGNGSMFSDLGVNGIYGFSGTSSPQDFALRTGSTNRLYIKHPTGFVGIGTINPETMLHVQGSGRVSENFGIASNNSIARLQLFENTSNALLALFEAEGGNRSIEVSNGIHTSNLGVADNYGFTGTIQPEDFALLSNNVPRLYIRYSSGNIGIGTINPQHILDVHSGFVPEIARFRNTTTDNANISVTNGTGLVDFGLNNVGGYVGTVNAGNFMIRTNYAVRMFFNHSNGFVGIGTINPDHKLDIQAYEHPEIAKFRNTTSDNAKIGVTNGIGAVDFGLNNVGGYVGTVDAGNFMIRTNYTVRMFFNHTNGYTGINTATPSQCLDVNGNIALSGNIMVEPPTNASLLNGWVIYDNAFGTPQYSKDKQGRVLISGLAEHTPTPGGHVFTLPAGFRPEKSMFILAASDHPNGFSKILINHLNGEVSVSTTGSNITWVSFDNITFRGI